MTDTAKMAKTTLGMSNFDHSIDEGLEEELRANEGEMWGGHAGWYFHGRVFFLDGVWHEEVWRYGTPVETVTAGTLQELMDAVCEKYGHE